MGCQNKWKLIISFFSFFPRQKFPRLESKNVQFWFKNRRAKCKRLKMSLYDTAQLGVLGQFGDLEDRKLAYPQAMDRDWRGLVSHLLQW